MWTYLPPLSINILHIRNSLLRHTSISILSFVNTSANLLRIFDHIQLLISFMFATISHLRSTGSSGIRFRSPYLVTTLKHEQSSWKMTRSGVHSHRSSECYGFHEDTVCQDHEIGYLGRYERSESMPLLHRENRPTSGRFQRMLQSSILITC